MSVIFEEIKPCVLCGRPAMFLVSYENLSVYRAPMCLDCCDKFFDDEEEVINSPKLISK